MPCARRTDPDGGDVGAGRDGAAGGMGRLVQLETVVYRVPICASRIARNSLVSLQAGQVVLVARLRPIR